MAEKLRCALEREILPGFIAGQRWFAAKGERIERVEVREYAHWAKEWDTWLLTWVDVHLAGFAQQSYFLPLAIAWETEEQGSALAPYVLAKVRQQARIGMLCDALADPAFCEALVSAMGQNVELPFGKAASGSLAPGPTGCSPGTRSCARSGSPPWSGPTPPRS